MKKIILFGAGPFAKQVWNIMKNDTRYKLCGFCTEKKYLQQNSFCGLPVYPFEQLHEFYEKKGIAIIICVGYKKMNTIRKDILYKCIGGGII